MKTHVIVPIFIPHYGCPYDCIFCDQRAITARDSAPDEAETRRRIEEYLSTAESNPNITHREIAFFGGSFTGIPGEEQEKYLRVAKEYKDSGRVGYIRLSTRPDYIDGEILRRLRRYGVDMVELGAQSFDDEVLRLSRRGHDSRKIEESAQMIRDAGLGLGIQLMVGLPGDSRGKCMESVRRTIALRPSAVRIYPTVVLRETGLHSMYLRGEYEPLKEEQAVDVVKDMLRAFAKAEIDVIRVGLKSSDLIGGQGGAVAAGSYHPAFRQLAEAAWAREELEDELNRQLKEIPKNDRRGLRVTFSAAPGSFSNMVGLRRSNRIYFSERYPELKLLFAVDSSLSRNNYRVRIEPETAL